ncbi:MAG TPA: DUF4134 family protein [Segetibacter sp.]|jgi:hypothetical protein
MVKNNPKVLTLLFFLIAATVVNAQNVGTGVDAAAGEVKGIFENVSNLVLMIGAVVGLVGGIRVFTKWQNGDNDVQKSLVGWIGASVFLLLTGTILKTMYGI